MPLSATARRAAYARESEEHFIELVRITHQSLSTPLRFANSRTDVVSRGDIYDGSAFNLVFPAQVEANEPTATVTVQNVDRTVEAALAALTSEPTFVIEAVLASAPDDVVIGPYRLPMRSSQSSMNELRITLGGADPMLTRKFPRAVFSQADFPGLSAT